MAKRKNKTKTKPAADKAARPSTPKMSAARQQTVLGQIGVMRLNAALLKLAAEQFSNHGCNDLDLRQFMPRPEDRRELMRAYHEWNGDTQAFDPTSEYNVVDDSAMMSWIAAQIEERVAELLASMPSSMAQGR